MSSVVFSFLTYLVILGACAFLLVRNIRHSFIIIFAIAAVLRCLAFAPAAFVSPDTSTSLPVIAIARAANFSSLVLFAAGFVMMALWFGAHFQLRLMPVRRDPYDSFIVSPKGTVMRQLAHQAMMRKTSNMNSTLNRQ